MLLVQVDANNKISVRAKTKLTNYTSSGTVVKLKRIKYSFHLLMVDIWFIKQIYKNLSTIVIHLEVSSHVH